MNQLALAAFEKALNHYINLDPESPSKLSKLEGKILKLSVKPITVFFCFAENHITIHHQEDEEKVTATLEGYPLAFIQLHFASKENAPTLFKQDLSIRGDIQFGQDVRDLFQTLDIDWEEHLSKFTGDVIAHEAMKWVHRSSSFFNKCSINLQQSLTEFLQEEAKYLPCREEVEDFCDDIDHLTLRVDRLEAKIKEML